MKIAVILGSYSTGTRPLDFWFNNIFVSSRGLTGTDLSTVMISKELRQLGHDVSIFVSHAQPNNRPSEWEGCKLYDFIDRHTVIDESFDAALSINEPDAFRGVNSKPLRICWQFLNDFTYCQPGFDDFVDTWLSVCTKHMEHLKSLSPRPDKWSVLSLGCTPELYEDKRIPGRVIWTSSCDRGLHWLLSQWSHIKEAVPEATLKIFYHFNYGDILNIEPNSTTNHPHVVEMGQRLRYIKEAIKRLKPLGVTQVGSVSRIDMVKEINEASVFAFSADTVAFTEGFSVSTMESHAGFTVPVMTDVDCLGSIYNNSGSVMIKSPIRDNLPKFTSSVIRALTDKKFADDVIDRCREFAKRHTWTIAAEKIENTITKSLNSLKKDNNLNKQIIKLNIGSGPNIFPYDGWINYDKVKLHSNFNYYLMMSKEMRRAEDSGTPCIEECIKSLNMITSEQQKIVEYMKNGGKIIFKEHNLLNGFPQHENNSIDYIYVGQTIEHINHTFQASNFIRECYRMLKIDGILRITTPDLDLLISAYVEGKMDKFVEEQPEHYKNLDTGTQLSMIMFGAESSSCIQSNYEGHMFLYTKNNMSKMLQSCGFKNIKYYYNSGDGSNNICKEIIDKGMSHSFIVEAKK